MAEAAEQYYQIGDVAERVGLSLRTVRYYEELGLVVPEKRTEGGFRLYSQDQIDRLDLVKDMKPLGFSVQEIGELLDARDAVTSSTTDEPAYLRARERMIFYAEAAAKRCVELRMQLARGESLTAQLDREAHRPRARIGVEH